MYFTNFAFGQTPGQQTIQFDLKDFSSHYNGNIAGAVMPVFNSKDQTKGSPYLFNNWVSATVIKKNNEIVNTKGYFFNYDKIGKRLLVSTDKKVMIDVDKTQLKSFTLTGPDGLENYFTRVNAIDSNIFLIAVLENENGYSLYKSINTKFIAANYLNKGLVESGNDYDEYLDSYQYFITQPKGAGFKQIDVLKTKTIKAAFPNETDKVNKFFKENVDADLNQVFLMSLLNNLND